MKNLLSSALVIAGLLLASTAKAQEPPKPGPEHAMLKKQEGTWDTVMKTGGMESKGTAVYKMDLGGLWLTSTFDGELFGSKFTGKGFDSYDPAKKKFVGVWIDSMSTSPMTMEGTYDKEKKTLTMSGEHPGTDGKPTKFKAVSEMKDDDNTFFSMFLGDGKAPAFTIHYKRKK
ncbi:MAG: DUF1579 domain-containing protein [Gemmataceae bacterium]|nr:DUF1579 domain-containing protein [Gemmataceae bacterium]